MELKSILDNIEKARTDDRIKGIYLNSPFVNAGLSQTEEIRNKLLDFKKSEKYETIYHRKDINPSVIFIKRCYKFIDNPPDKDWDGHYRLDKK